MATRSGGRDPSATRKMRGIEAPQSENLADQLVGIADTLRLQTPMPVRDWLAQYLAGDGDVLNTDEAAYVLGCHRDTARSRADRAARTDKPIAILVAGATWLFSEIHLLDSIEAESGRHERFAAETRASEMRKLRHKTKVMRPVRIETESQPSTTSKKRPS